MKHAFAFPDFHCNLMLKDAFIFNLKIYPSCLVPQVAALASSTET